MGERYTPLDSGGASQWSMSSARLPSLARAWETEKVYVFGGVIVQLLTSVKYDISYIFHTLIPGFSVELLMFGVASLDDFSGSC